MKSWEAFFLNAALAGALAWAMIILCVVLIFKGFLFWLASPK